MNLCHLHPVYYLWHVKKHAVFSLEYVTISKKYYVVSSQFVCLSYAWSVHKIFTDPLLIWIYKILYLNKLRKLFKSCHSFPILLPKVASLLNGYSFIYDCNWPCLDNCSLNDFIHLMAVPYIPHPLYMWSIYLEWVSI